MGKYSDIAERAEQAMSIKYNTLVYELKKKGIKVLVMSLGEAFFDVPLYSFAELPTSEIYHYSHSLGIPELRKKLADYFLKQYAIPLNADKEILITAGSKIAIYMALMAILDPGDEVVVQEPCWVSYPEQIRLAYGVPVQIPYDKTIYDYEKYITPRTKAIIINNPHNPTGYVYTEKEIIYLLELAAKHNVWLLSDEAYSDFVVDGKFISPGSIDKEKNHTIIFNSISKNFGISGWRLGYIISNEKMIHNVLKINQHLITCPATILEYYVLNYFEKILSYTVPMMKELHEKRKAVAAYMKNIGLDCLPGSATFYFFVSIAPTKLTSEEFCTRLLTEQYISVVPGLGYGYSCDKFIRISIGTATLDEIKGGLDKIKEFIIKTS
jgi:aspartate/methionine/tyrosine aminotransferase